tara:strand:+ start:498 stop:710 length:213 start_codon:yes stop_codon:yes gene_type:complete
MKFVLVISLCSFIDNTCLAPAEVKVTYNSWKECAIAAYDLSKEIIIAQKGNFVNHNKLATKFICNEVGEI